MNADRSSGVVHWFGTTIVAVVGIACGAVAGASTTPGAAEAWMREVQTSPADFLKQKFSIQAATAPQPSGPRQ